MIYKIHEAFIADPLIASKVGKRIKFYEYPAAGDVSGPIIVIDPIAPPIPTDYADNDWLTEEYLFQIEVWSKSKTDTDAIAKRMQRIMWKEIGFGQSGSGVDEWDKDFGIFRDARRYTGKAYIN
ncbi:hypothetical protein GJU40_01530 [Bacillus lacus]|uniref:DUF3168 domain-containing protein n=1 Tax=Metabacillus lacus TaxID=1983721 RepID=A0A7X2IW33_9BACI|nr:hypothetical protein [Metabacillus lacus]MRX70847.1 hypothetical protein [Metabacillus lacus]